ncbi:uncharacterized protein MONBRDRAFT_9695 [Monosiga brevicollis MX1]|uniref:Uncharacterized protein n=1 Tax=Monosiga brevicollis TaxID=81824 RepID=A9V3H8_MONBE|nr:uncharacterized protein MONBRDRAFT_9695 [Monosiga brevicollis MX1]EDQ87915.1 predicted protein [Monosiga brevicollis MX1]|eukprot:XP_001747448.1 hypothetical protein [Monosiga brevicollis MX1]
MDINASLGIKVMLACAPMHIPAAFRSRASSSSTSGTRRGGVAFSQPLDWTQLSISNSSEFSNLLDHIVNYSYLFFIFIMAHRDGAYDVGSGLDYKQKKPHDGKDHRGITHTHTGRKGGHAGWGDEKEMIEDGVRRYEAEEHGDNTERMPHVHDNLSQGDKNIRTDGVFRSEDLNMVEKQYND